MADIIVTTRTAKLIKKGLDNKTSVVKDGADEISMERKEEIIIKKNLAKHRLVATFIFSVKGNVELHFFPDNILFKVHLSFAKQKKRGKVKIKKEGKKRKKEKSETRKV
ncbi:MAG: hypothetical protein HGN29_08145 [Asgard group archaeon]|nr:hypothetical protein [Asgard group archaeon]